MLVLCGDRSHKAEGAYKGGAKVTPRDRGASLHSYPILRPASINTYILPTELSSGASLLWAPFSHIECRGSPFLFYHWLEPAAVRYQLGLT